MSKIVKALEDALQGNWARATFVGVDIARGPDWNAVLCPRCRTGHRWRKRTPKECRNCGLEFRIISTELPSEETK